jgi:hypothetical protein
MDRVMGALLAVAAATMGCGGGDENDFEYPLDDTLRLHELQARGTHNSYHIAPDPFVLPDWNYTHSSLDDQLRGGMRQFELDLNRDAELTGFDVYHIIRLDAATTCARFEDCLAALKDWSDDNRGHHPISVMLEIKDAFQPEVGELYFTRIEEAIASVWPSDRLVTPDLVRAGAATLRDAIVSSGWPTLGELRGRVLFWIHNDGEYRDLYTRGGVGLDGRLAFVRADFDAPYAAIRVLDDPIDGAGAIAEAVAANMLVRTRLDVLGEETYELDPDRIAAAEAAGAHFLSTDDEGYMLPGGEPSRCNPVTAQSACTAVAIESPEFVD